MIAGSTSYTFMNNIDGDIIAVNSAIPYDDPVINYHLDYISYGSPFFVRESGVFCLFFEIGSNEASQFSIFVNGVVVPITCISTNSGAGQIVVRQLFNLNKNDSIEVRNFSSMITVNSDMYAGGTQKANSASMIIFKIAALPTAVPCEEKLKCLSHKKKKLFKKLEEKIECDPELMAKGFTTQGSFTNTLDQLVALEGDVVFTASNDVNNVAWNVSNPTQVTILEDGIYSCYFQLNSQTAAQFALTVNGVPDENTTFGTNKGAGQLDGRSLLTLHVGDVLTMRNHSSNVGTVNITSNAGGLASTVSALFMLFKLAPIVPPCIKPTPCELEKKLNCLYPLFKNYLLCQHELQVAGSSAYIALVNASKQTVTQNQAFYLSIASDVHDVSFLTGSRFLTIQQSGVYDIFAEVATNEPVQIAILVNGVVIPYTTFGRDSGAARCRMRQFIELNKGDQVSVVNNLSASASVTTVSSGNGAYVSSNLLLSLFKAHSICKK